MEAYRAKGRTAVIFGSSGTIGPGVARAFYQEGASLAVHYRKSKDDAEKIVDDANKFYAEHGLDAKAYTIQADVLERDTIKRAKDDVLKNSGTFYYLLLFQDFSLDRKLWNLEDPEFVEKNKDMPYKIAYVGTVNVIDEFAPHLMERKEGSIIVVGSSAVFDWYDKGEYYTAAKTSIAQLMPQYADVLGRHGVRINGIAPGWVPKGTEDPEEMKSEAEQIKLWRHGENAPEAKMGKPEMIGEATFAMANFKYVHGQYLLVDGGQASPIPWVPDEKNIEFLKKQKFKERYPVESKVLGKTV